MNKTLVFITIIITLKISSFPDSYVNQSITKTAPHIKTGEAKLSKKSTKRNSFQKTKTEVITLLENFKKNNKYGWAIDITILSKNLKDKKKSFRSFKAQ